MYKYDLSLPLNDMYGLVEEGEGLVGVGMGRLVEEGEGVVGVGRGGWRDGNTGEGLVLEGSHNPQVLAENRSAHHEIDCSSQHHSYIDHDDWYPHSHAQCVGV